MTVGLEVSALLGVGRRLRIDLEHWVGFQV